MKQQYNELGAQVSVVLVVSYVMKQQYNELGAQVSVVLVVYCLTL